MAVDSPRTNVHASVGARFFRQGRYECLGVDWGVCMGIYCFLFLTGGVGPGFRSILAMASTLVDILATGGEFFSVGARVSVWVLSGFLSGLRYLPGRNK